MGIQILILITLFVFIIGTVIGSFLNVVALRGLTGESFILPASKCPHCQNKLKPWHNIPILSYVFLGGKCAFCKEKISVQYPIVEIITGLLLVGSLFKFGPTVTGAFVFIACCTLLVMSITDIREKVICAGHAWFLILMGLAYNIFLSYNTITSQLAEKGYFLFTFNNFFYLPIVSSIIGLIAGIIIMEILARLGYLIVGKRAFGEGDTFIAAGLGAYFGWMSLLIILGISVIVQVGIIIPGFFKKLAARNDSKTIAALVLFFIAAAAFSASKYYFGILESTVASIIASIVLLIIGIYACIRVIKGIKEDSDLTVLPFGPAMAIATVIVLFAIAV